jgi:hypothetical protein
MVDFLTFKTFISSYVLIFFYYIFALIMPIFLFYFRKKLFQIELFYNFYPKLKNLTYDKLSIEQKAVINLFLFGCFILCEIFLRMFFEFLIGYIQIRDILVGGG